MASEARVIYCPKCGRSSYRKEKLSTSNDYNCDGDFCFISIEGWREIAPRLRLTDEGRRVLDRAGKDRPAKSEE